MNVSEAGLALIREFEGCRLTAYPDPGTGGEPWTIGFGHTAGVKMGDTCTQDQADAWLRTDVQGAVRCVVNSVTVPLSQGQIDALTSFVFNLGCSAFRNSSLLRMLNAGHDDAAAQQFERWNRAGGHVLAGLTARREAERELFLA